MEQANEACDVYTQCSKVLKLDHAYGTLSLMINHCDKSNNMVNKHRKTRRKTIYIFKCVFPKKVMHCIYTQHRINITIILC